MDDQSGWYYLLVAGHNGANDPATPYSLSITLTSGLAATPADVAPPVFPPLDATYPDTRTLILTNSDRLAQRFDPDRTATLMQQLSHMAADPHVDGAVLDLALILNSWPSTASGTMTPATGLCESGDRSHKGTSGITTECLSGS